MNIEKERIKIGQQEVRVGTLYDRSYVCLSDLEKLSTHKEVRDWLRNLGTIEFLEIWEKTRQTDFNWEKWMEIRATTKFSDLYVTPTKWLELGGEALFVQRGRFGGIFAELTVATQFANWLDTTYYINLIDSYLHKERLALNTYKFFLQKAEDDALEAYRLIKEVNQKMIGDKSKK